MATTRLDEARELIAISRRDLQEMERLRSFDLYYGTVNRAYYAIFHAIFHAISALLLADGKEFQKHKAVISHFGRYYSKAGKTPAHLHRFFIDAYELRQKADYELKAVVTKEMANELCVAAREIVDFMDNAVAARQLNAEK
jgi:uncharacterized protein (UPF0332 family)